MNLQELFRKDLIDSNCSINEGSIEQWPTQQVIINVWQEINKCISQIQNKIGDKNIESVIKKLYQRIKENCSSKSPSNSQKEHRNLQAHKIITNQQSSCKKQQESTNNFSFQIRQIVPKTRIKKQKQESVKSYQSNHKFSYDKIEKRSQKSDDFDRTSTKYRMISMDVSDNINRCLQWSYSKEEDKQHRLYCSKITPKFNSKDQQKKYFQKRLAAKQFCRKKYEKMIQENADRFQKRDSIDFSGINAKKNDNQEQNQSFNKHFSSFYAKNVKRNYVFQKRYKNVSVSFVSEAYRKFQLFIMQKVDKKIRQLTGNQMRQLYPILLNANIFFPEQLFYTFRRFVKLTFDLGSVSVYELSSKLLYRKIQQQLAQKINQNKLESNSMTNDEPIPRVQQQDFKKQYPYSHNKM